MGAIDDGEGLGPEESLALIRESLRGARRVHAADGRYLVAWGLAVFAASVASFALAAPRLFGALDDAGYVSALCALLGLVNWGSASAFRASWFRAVAALWWLGALSIPFLDRSSALLAATALVLLGQVLPGSVLLIRDLRGRAHA